MLSGPSSIPRPTRRSRVPRTRTFHLPRRDVHGTIRDPTAVVAQPGQLVPAPTLRYPPTHGYVIGLFRPPRVVARHGFGRRVEQVKVAGVFDGDFEVHLTLLADPRLTDFAVAQGLKYTRIVLDRGVTPDQPMLTFHARGQLSAVAAEAQRWEKHLSEDGFTVVRLKVEASPFNAGVPQLDADASPDRYFEHHVKLVIDGAGLDLARGISLRHNAHVSRNARRGDPEGRHERFVTQRCHDCGRPEAHRRLDALLAELTAAGLSIVEVEREYVVLDSNPAVDAGWIRA